MAYTTNYCPNPSFQLGLGGYTMLPTQATTRLLDSHNRLYGTASLLIDTPGLVAGEGVSTATAVVTTTGVGSASTYLKGSGQFTVQVIITPGPTLVASVPVTLTNNWQRVIVNNISILAGQAVFLNVITSSKQNTIFWISGTQVEDTTPAHPYVDGDQDGCIWTTNQWGGVSQQLYQNPIASVSAGVTASNLVNILQTGLSVFATPLISASHVLDPLVVTGAPGPSGAITDFSVAKLTDPDPAQTYVSWNNANEASALTGNYFRSWSAFIPPQDYLVSNGQLLYKRAAYMGLGWLYSSVPNTNTIGLTKVQAEELPLSGGFSAPGPSTFDPPRSVHPLIVADRINFVTNPSFEVSTANWVGTGSATIAQDSTKNVGQIAIYDDSILTTGSHSLNVTINSSGDGALINVGNLIPGYTYIASAYVQAGPGLFNILMSIANGSTSIVSSGGTGYGSLVYGGGFYGGINPTADVPVNTWFRIYCTFTADADSDSLIITSASAGDVVYPTHMWLDAVLVEQGQVLGGYFDGGTGKNYEWETGGTAGLSRSYHYDQMAVKQQAVLNVLNRHTPLGISFAQPKYAVTPIQ